MNKEFTGKTALLSVSMAVVATQAMAYVAKQGEGVYSVETTTVSDEVKKRIEAVTAQRDSKQAVANAFQLLAKKFGEEEISLAKKYFPDGVEYAQASSDDFTINPYAEKEEVTGCYANCHSACHHACHGSRGWR